MSKDTNYLAIKTSVKCSKDKKIVLIHDCFNPKEPCPYYGGFTKGGRLIICKYNDEEEGGMKPREI